MGDGKRASAGACEEADACGCDAAAFDADQDATMPVAERFVSINGEGVHAGRLASFVRFAGCNLRCSYCDTMWANERGCPVEPMTVDRIASWVRAQPAACTTLTGGEPALQPLLPGLVRALLDLPPVEDGAEGRSSRIVEVETNGSVDLSRLVALRDAPPNESVDAAHASQEASRLCLTMDWKLPSSGMEQRMLPGNLELLGADDTVKFVAGSYDDLREMLRVVRAHRLCDRCAVYASPVFGRIEPAQIVDFLRDHGLARVVVQLQLHKVIWPNTEKGV